MTDEEKGRLRLDLFNDYQREIRKIRLDIRFNVKESYYEIINAFYKPFAIWKGDRIIFGNGQKYPTKNIHDVVEAIKHCLGQYGVKVPEEK